MLCHILFDHEHSYRFYLLIEKYFDLQDHRFILLGSSRWDDRRKNVYKNSICSEDLQGAEIADLLQSASAIVVNGLFYDAVLNLFASRPELLHKTSWVIWGGDVYDEKRETEFTPVQFEASLFGLREYIADFWNNLRLSRNLSTPPWSSSTTELKRRYFIRSIPNVIGISEIDYQFLKRTYQMDATYTFGFIPLLIDWDHFRPIGREKNPEKKDIHILVGNSATETNRHDQVFQLLSKFKDSNIRIYCPLVYGDSRYRDSVIEKGRKLFQEKFFPLTDFMQHDAYFDWLKQMDVAIMNQHRQQALGSILSLFLHAIPVYMPVESAGARFLATKGLQVRDISAIESIENIKQLAENDASTTENQEKVIEQFSDNAWKEVWSKIFSSLS